MTARGFEVTTALSGKEMFSAMSSSRVDSVILDLCFPGESGLDLCQRLRTTSNVPVLMLTGVADKKETVRLLDAGADDYVIKPFDPLELEARIRALLRRREGGESRSINVGGFLVDLDKRKVSDARGEELLLSGTEYDLLVTFIKNAQRPVTRAQLVERVRGKFSTLSDRSVDVLVSRLRQKLEPDPQSPRIITTVWGFGYMLDVDVLEL